MLDRLIIESDKILKTLFGTPVSKRAHPDCDLEEANLSQAQKNEVIALMRINHCGEVCAQALYLGQALTARDKTNQSQFIEASNEEEEHLAWTSKRLKELGGRVSLLNPLFYLGSMALGVCAGVCGDKWSLGFLEETENQVSNHLEKHLDKLPANDKKSIAILKQMIVDEQNHAKTANLNGAAPLPSGVSYVMKLMSKVMTSTTHYI